MVGMRASNLTFVSRGVVMGKLWDPSPFAAGAVWENVQPKLVNYVSNCLFPRVGEDIMLLGKLPTMNSNWSSCLAIPWEKCTQTHVSEVTESRILDRVSGRIIIESVSGHHHAHFPREIIGITPMIWKYQVTQAGYAGYTEGPPHLHCQRIMRISEKRCVWIQCLQQN